MTGYGGLETTGLWTLDFRGKASDREIIVANTPAIPGGNEGLLHIVSIMQGIGEMEYGGRLSGKQGA